LRIIDIDRRASFAFAHNRLDGEARIRNDCSNDLTARFIALLDSSFVSEPRR
jgi:hypothetical protein